MPQPVPRVAHIPRVQASYVVGDEKCGSREPHVGKYWIDVLGEGSVAVIERQKECGMRSTECGIAGLEPLGELVSREGLPTCSRQRRHLPREHRLRDPCDSELELAADAMVAKCRRTRRGWDLPHQFRNPHS